MSAVPWNRSVLLYIHTVHSVSGFLMDLLNSYTDLFCLTLFILLDSINLQMRLSLLVDPDQ